MTAYLPLTPNGRPESLVLPRYEAFAFSGGRREQTPQKQAAPGHAPVDRAAPGPTDARLQQPPWCSAMPAGYAMAGLSAVLYADAAGELLAFARSVPLDGSNELELGAAVFGLEQADRLYPGMAFALFSDNLDAIRRLARAKMLGCALDAELGERFPRAPSTLGWRRRT